MLNDFTDTTTHRIICKKNGFIYICESMHSLNALAVLFSEMNIDYTIIMNSARSIAIVKANTMRLNKVAYETFMLESGYVQRNKYGKIQLTSLNDNLVH